jgi:hypothetical protein
MDHRPSVKSGPFDGSDAVSRSALAHWMVRRSCGEANYLDASEHAPLRQDGKSRQQNNPVDLFLTGYLNI